MTFGTTTLLVMILLVSATSVASYLFSQWAPMRSTGRTLAWAGLGGGTVLLLAAAAVLTLSMHSLSTLQLPWKESLPEHMIEPAQPQPSPVLSDPQVAELMRTAKRAMQIRDWNAALDALVALRYTANLSAAENHDVLGYLVLVQEQRQDYVSAASALDKLLALRVLPEGERMSDLRHAVELNYRTEFYADAIRYGREYLAHYSDDDGAVRKMLEQANTAYNAIGRRAPAEEPRGYEPVVESAYAPEPAQ